MSKHIGKYISVFLVVILLLSLIGSEAFAQDTITDLGPVTSKDVIDQIITNSLAW